MKICFERMVDDHEYTNADVNDDMNHATNDDDNKECGVVAHANEKTSMETSSTVEILNHRRDNDEMTKEKRLSMLKKNHG